MLHPIYDYTDYRAYVSETLAGKEFGRGARNQLAQHLNCQSSFISQVLSGKSELSLEHAIQVNGFFGHEGDEGDFFMAMVQLSRAGSHDLEVYFQKLLEKLRTKKMQVENVVWQKELSKEDVLGLYGDWVRISMFLLSGIKKYSNVDQLRTRMQVSEKEFGEALSFLEKVGLVVRKGEEVQMGESKIHLKKDSPYAQTVSVLVRQKVLEKLKVSDPESLNYGAHFAVSEKAYKEMKKQALDFIANWSETMNKDSEPEKLCTVVLDLVEH